MTTLIWKKRVNKKMSEIEKLLINIEQQQQKKN